MKGLTNEEFQKKLKSLKTMGDAHSFAKELVAPILQEMLEEEMNNHLGYSKHDNSGDLSGNSRNGYSTKTVKGSFGAADLSIPRDRKGEFEPVAVRKYETVDNELEEKIISMYGKGMTTRDIESHINDIYGVSVSSGMVSSITDKILPLVREWQSRSLDSLYLVLYLDGIHFKVRDGGRMVNKCAYTMLGINSLGRKEILGIWIGENEGAKYWLQVLNEIKNRGVNDVLICCIDGLMGFSDAIKAVFPDTHIQRCIIHQIRNTVKYIPTKDRKLFCNDLKSIYHAPTEEAALEALESMKEKWKKYAVYLESWKRNWDELSLFFLFPEVIRKMIYTTNSIEGVHRQIRKVTKTTTCFPHDEALTKLLWLAIKDISKKWTQPVRNWSEIIAQFTIMYPERNIIIQ